MKDEDIEGTRDKGSNDEDEKREVMLTNPDSKQREGDVVEEKGNLMQVQVEHFLKATAAEHDRHRGAQADTMVMTTA
jgi:hypothetical protein